MEMNDIDSTTSTSANPEGLSMKELLGILKRRKWDILLPALFVFALAVLAAVSIPKRYQATTTILIEEQEVPREYVATNITSFADQRLQTINQRIMSTTKLLDLINRFKLYDDLKDKDTMDEIVGQMRSKDIKFTTISADVIDPRTGRPAQATIAFSVSYSGKNPETVQKVATELASLYLLENLNTREKQSEQTSKFMSDEMNAVQARLKELDGKIASYKQRNLSSLPELSQMNIQGLDQVERDIVRLEDQLRTLREREGYLQQQVASTPTDLRMREKDTLRDMRMQLADLKGRFSDEYPDVMKLKSAIRELERQLGSSASGSDKPENPAYVTLASQLAGTQSEIESVKRQTVEMRKKIDMYLQRVKATPRVEEGYKTLLLERNNLQVKFDELTKKTMDSHVAQGMEKEQLGERFSIVDPARLPEKPASPNVPAILLIGLVLGLGSGVGVAAVREGNDDTVRGPDSLADFPGLPVLACIPEILTAAGIRSSRNKRLLAIFAGSAVLILCLLAVHYFIIDLDLVIAKILRRIQG